MLKKIKIFLLFMAFVFPLSTAGAAGFEGPGSHSGVTTAAQVNGAPEETPCALEGRIIEKLPQRNNCYLFEDQSGRAIIQINNGVFGTQTITPGDVVRIVGAINFDGKYPNTVAAESLGIVAPKTTYTN